MFALLEFALVPLVDLRRTGFYKQNKKMATKWKYVGKILGGKCFREAVWLVVKGL